MLSTQLWGVLSRRWGSPRVQAWVLARGPCVSGSWGAEGELNIQVHCRVVLMAPLNGRLSAVVAQTWNPGWHGSVPYRLLAQGT